MGRGILRTVIAWFSKNRFVCHALVLTGGTALGQGLVILAAPMLTRLYSPSDFGVLAVYSSLLSLLVVVASLRYELAIPLPEEDDKAGHLLVLGLLLVLFTSVGTGGLVWLLQEQILTYTGAEALRPYLWTLPLGLLGAGSYQLVSYWAVRKKAFPVIAQTKLRQNLGMVAAQAGAGMLGFGPVGLLLGDLIGRVSGTAALAKTLDWQRLVRVRPRHLRSVAVSYADFPLIMLWAALFNTAASQAPLILLPRHFGLEVLGLYFLAYRVLNLPVSVLAAAISQVFFAEIARSPDKAHMRKVTRSVTTLIAALALPLYLGLAFVAPQVFAHCFGPRWAEAGEFARWLAPVMPLRLVATTLSNLQTVARRFRESLAFTVLELAGVLLAIWIGIRCQSVHAFVVSMSAITVLVALASVWRFARVADLGVVDLLPGAFGPVLAINLPFLLILLLGVLYLPGLFPVFVWLGLSVPVLLFSLWRLRVRLSIAAGSGDIE